MRTKKITLQQVAHDNGKIRKHFIGVIQTNILVLEINNNYYCSKIADKYFRIINLYLSIIGFLRLESEIKV